MQEEFHQGNKVSAEIGVVAVVAGVERIRESMLSIGTTGWATPCLRSEFLDSLSPVSALERVSVQTLLILSSRNNSTVRRGSSFLMATNRCTYSLANGL